MAELARLISAFLLTRSTLIDGRQIIENTRLSREVLEATIWARYLKPYFIGPGTDPFDVNNPLSPFAAIIQQGVRESIAITVEQQTAILRQVTRGADDVYQYLTGGRPFFTSTVPPASPRGFYDPFHRFVDPNGYRLSDRIWNASVSTRSRVNKLLDYHIAKGTSAVDMAKELERFLTPGASVQFTNTPYGTEGSYAARRLARTEITAEAGRATVNASIANPFVEGVRWALSRSHRCCDICDDYATGGDNADGVYEPDKVPTYPAHPHELCNLQPVAVASRADVVNKIRADMRDQRNMQGLFNQRFMADGLINGMFSDAVGAAVFEMAVIYA
jgi:hypothetical protein